MVRKLKSIFLSTLNSKFGIVVRRKKPEDDFINDSYSQEGEDKILERLFLNHNKGFYVDIGAHHPFRFSNTFMFYKKGWRGINVDPLPQSKLLFDEHRPDDINLCLGVSQTGGKLIYHMFNDSALNTLNEHEAIVKDGWKNGRYFIVEKKEIDTKTLKDILDTNLEENQKIDFLTIDVEGLDLEVLKSNDWSRYKPEVILVEELRSDISTIITKSLIYKYIIEKGYSLYCRTYNTSIYLKNKK